MALAPENNDWDAGSELAKPEWGTKRTCQTCGAKFYDMSRNPPTCPSCDAVWEAVAAKPTRRARPAAKPAKPEPKAKSAAADDDDDMDTGSEADSEADTDTDSDSDKKDDDVIEDPSELGEDEDDMAEVVVTQEKDDN